MKRLFIVAALFSFVGLAWSADKVLGVMTTTGTSINSCSGATDAGSLFLINGGGAKLSVQCPAAAYVGSQRTDAGTCSSTTCPKVAADQLFDIDMAASEPCVSEISVSGTVSCVWYRRTTQY